MVLPSWLEIIQILTMITYSRHWFPPEWLGMAGVRVKHSRNQLINLKHCVVVFRFLWNSLSYAPVLYNHSIFHAKNMHKSSSKRVQRVLQHSSEPRKQIWLPYIHRQTQPHRTILISSIMCWAPSIFSITHSI